MKRTGKDVLCETCGISLYIYPHRFKNKHHTCSQRCSGVLSSKLHSKKVEVPCQTCGKSVFYKQSHFKQIKNYTCSRQCRNELIKVLGIYKGKNNPRALKFNPIEKFFWNKLQDLEYRASVKKIDFDLTHEYMMQLYDKQNKLCYYSSYPLNINTSGRAKFDTLSVDRIDSNKGYTKDNIVYCLNSINMFKAHHDVKDIITVMNYIHMKASKNINLKIKSLNKDSKLPSKNSLYNAGYDLYTNRIEDCGHYLKIYSGISIEPPTNYYMMLVPRSSAHKYGLTLYNNLGIIDQNFRGEIVGLFLKTNNFIMPEIGSRLMQLIPQEQIQVTFQEVQSLSETERGDSGFGSSGK